MRNAEQQLQHALEQFTLIEQARAEVDRQRHELEELASWINSQKSELQTSTTAVEYRAAELHSREAALHDAVADLAENQKAMTALEYALREREGILAMDELRVSEARLHLTAAETLSLDASGRMTEAESIRIAAEEKMRKAEQQLQHALEHFTLVEQARAEVDRQRHELEQLQQDSQERYAQAVRLEEQLITRAAGMDEQQTRLALSQQEFETQRQELNLLRASLTDQLGALEQRVSQLNQREVELSARAAQLSDESSNSTRSVEQLMAIAAEKESAIRSRQEAARAMEELKAAKAALADKELLLTSRQAEIENRSTELAERVLRLKSERDAIRVKEQQFRNSSLQAEADVAALQEQHQRLLERQAEFTELEKRAIERENAANVVLRNAEAERDELQLLLNDLICERNSLMQFSEDLNSRASELSERESAVMQQTEELQSRFFAMNQQSSELQRLENELNLRAEELHRRVTQFKSENRDQGATSVSAEVAELSGAKSASVSSIRIYPKTEQELSEALQASESQLDGVEAERDALLAAVRELQRAMLDAHADVEEANRLRAESSSQEQTLATLYRTIEERSSQLQLLESRLRQAESHTESLERQLQTYHSGGTPAESSVTQTESSGTSTNVNFGDGHTESGEVEAELMRQLEELKAELKSGGQNYSRNEDSAFAVREQDRIIDELRLQNEALQARISDLTSMPDDKDAPVSMIQVDELQAKLNRATEVISDRDDLIRELRIRLSKQVEQSADFSANENINAADLQKEARELDRRASVLDTREEEVREQLRMVSNAQEEVENQRRQLLDARQQLEVARTEIQVAMKQNSVVTNYATESETSKWKVNEESSTESLRPGAAIFGMEAEPVSLLTDEDDEASASAALDLRAELASLFGLNEQKAVQPAQELLSTQEMQDASEPLGAEKPVALHFGEDASRIISGHVEEPTPESSASADEEDTSDDFVRDYMEQLLSRSRKSAGNSLPSELSGGGKGRSSGPSPAPAARKKPEAAATKSPPKAKSYIDQYMADGSMPIEDSGASDSNATHAEARGDNPENAPMIPRAKVDVEKLRQNMDSFRSVSTHSVEKALVTHALRTERLSINGRIFLVCVMGFMSVFFAIANYKGIINSIALILVTLLGAIVAGLELTRKMYAVKSKGKALVRCEESCAGKLGSGAKVEATDRTDSGSATKLTAPEPPPIPLTPSAIPGDDSTGKGPANTMTSPYAAIAAVTATEEMESLPTSPSLS
jgi:chromosome segregation ATPase